MAQERREGQGRVRPPRASRVFCASHGLALPCPDLAQTFVVTCMAKNIPFHFKGLSTLKIKETDRIEALKTEVRKLGFVLKDLNDSELLWDGERCEPSYEPIDTYEDHRMALAFAPFALLMINNPQVVSKSYPKFWEDLKAAGFEIEFTGDGLQSTDDMLASHSDNSSNHL